MAKLPGTGVTNFIRGPAWVYYRAPPSKHLGREVDNPNPAYTETEKEQFRNPEYHQKYRKGIVSRTNKSFYIFLKGDNNHTGMKAAAKQMAEKLAYDERLCEMLIPKWELGCRRITPGPGYLESFLRPNCHLTNSPITRISKNAVNTADGKVHEVDVGGLAPTTPSFPLNTSFCTDELTRNKQSSAQPASTSRTARATPSSASTISTCAKNGPKNPNPTFRS